MKTIEEFISTLDLFEEGKEFYVDQQHIIGYLDAEYAKTFIVGVKEPSIQITIYRNELLKYRRNKVTYLKIGNLIISLYQLLRIPLEIYELIVYTIANPLFIKYYDKYFVIASHICCESCKHEIKELKKNIKIKKLSEY